MSLGVCDVGMHGALDPQRPHSLGLVRPKTHRPGLATTPEPLPSGTRCGGRLVPTPTILAARQAACGVRAPMEGVEGGRRGEPRGIACAPTPQCNPTFCGRFVISCWSCSRDLQSIRYKCLVGLHGATLEGYTFSELCVCRALHTFDLTFWLMCSVCVCVFPPCVLV